MQEKNTVYGKTLIKYNTRGIGPAVVLIHGFGEDASIWESISKTLERRYYLIMPDLPGTGASDLLTGLNTNLTDYSACIKAVLEAESINTCIMIGHSMGGYITLAFAEAFPKMLRAFGLFHSGAFADDQLKVESREKAIEFIDRYGSHAFLVTTFPSLFHDKHNPQQIAALIHKGRWFSKNALIQYYQAMKVRPDRTSVLRNSKVPVLFILGEHDKAIPYKQGLQQSHIAARSYIYVLRNSAHMGMLEEAERSAQILANFLLAC